MIAKITIPARSVYGIGNKGINIPCGFLVYAQYKLKVCVKSKKLHNVKYVVSLYYYL